MPVILLICSALLVPPVHPNAVPDSLTAIIPSCEQAAFVPGPKFKFTGATRIILGTETTRDDRAAASMLVDAVRERKLLDLRIVSEDAVRRVSTNYIFLGTPFSAFIKRGSRTRSRSTPENLGPEGYALDVSADGILIAGKTFAGRLHAIQSLIQLLTTEKKNVVVPTATILDRPVTAFRGASITIQGPAAAAYDYVKTTIRILGSYKMNALVVSWNEVREDEDGTEGYPFNATHVRDLEEYGRLHGVELIPSVPINGLGESRTGAIWETFHSQKIFLRSRESEDRSWHRPVREEGKVWDMLRTTRKTFYADLGAFSEIVRRRKEFGDRVALVAGRNEIDSLPRRVAGLDRRIIPTIVLVRNPAAGTTFPDYDTFISEMQRIIEMPAAASAGILLSSCRHDLAPRSHDLERLAFAWTSDVAWRGDSRSISERFFRQEFGADDAVFSAQTCYALLSDPSTLVRESDLGRHPLMRDAGSITRSAERLQHTMPVAVSAAVQLEQRATSNGEHAKLLAFVARLNTWLGNSSALAERIQDTVRVHRMNDRQPSRSMLTAIATLRDQLDSLSNVYRSIVPRSDNESFTLCAPLDGWWRRIGDDIGKSITPSIPISPGEWITAVSIDSSDGTLADSVNLVAVFRTAIQLDEQLDVGWMQVFGSVGESVFVNGIQARALDIPASFNNSVSHPYFLTKFLRHGANTLEIQTMRTGFGISPAVNFYGELTLRDGTVREIASDSTWVTLVPDPSGTRATRPARTKIVRAAGLPILREDVRFWRTGAESRTGKP